MHSNRWIGIDRAMSILNEFRFRPNNFQPFLRQLESTLWALGTSYCTWDSCCLTSDWPFSWRWPFSENAFPNGAQTGIVIFMGCAVEGDKIVVGLAGDGLLLDKAIYSELVVEVLSHLKILRWETSFILRGKMIAMWNIVVSSFNF